MQILEIKAKTKQKKNILGGEGVNRLNALLLVVYTLTHNQKILSYSKDHDNKEKRAYTLLKIVKT